MRMRGPMLAALLGGVVVIGCGGSSITDGSPVAHVPTCGGQPLAAGNQCCTDGKQRPDCTLSVLSTGYWELPCPTPYAITCAAPYAQTADLPAGVLLAVYTTGSFHVMPGQVKVTLDGAAAGTFDAALPPGTINPPLNLGTVGAGSHTLGLQYSSTDGELPHSWGGFLDLYVKQ